MKFLLFLSIVLPAVVLHSSAASAQNVDETLAAAYRSDARFTALRDAGGTYEGILSIERLPTGAFVSEIGVAFGGQTVRYPVKLERAATTWSVSWAPVAEYAAALAGIARSGALPAARASDPWTDVARMPALGVVATKARTVTPFGVVDPAESRQTQQITPLDQSPTLILHAQRWVQEVLDKDPGPAGIDVLLDARLDWRGLNKILFNFSAVGLYQVWLVTRNEEALHQVAVSAPIGGISADAPVVALYKLDNGGFGFRITGPTVSDPQSECVPGFRICVTSAEELAASLERHLGPGGEHAMFAAAADVVVGDAIALLAAFIDYMGLAPHGVLLGFVEQ